MLALVLALSLTQSPQHRLFMQPNLPRARAESFAFFEFAPASGKGMGAPCACTSPTGAKGEVLTFTRASSGTCLKGNTTTGVANGGMVTCANNQARVMPGGDGTGGVGLLVEGPRTNVCIRSEEISNASWTNVASGAAAPVFGGLSGVQLVTGSNTEQFTFAATTGAQSSGRLSAGSASCTSVQCAFSYYVQGVSASGTLDICAWGSTATCSPCAFVAGSWSRCSIVATIAGAPAVFIGNSSANNGGTARAQAVVYVTAAQEEVGGVATSYIATAGASSTRAADAASFAFSPALVATGSMATTVVIVEHRSNGGFLSAESGTTFKQSIIGFGGPRMYVGGVSLVGPLAFPSGTWRFAGWWTGAATGLISNGAETVGAAGTPAATDTLRIGNYSNGASEQQYGVFKRVCYDFSNTRCR